MSEYIKSMEHNKMFLLSTEEYKYYTGKISNINTWWWLRSPGGSTYIATCVDYNGGVDNIGGNVSLNRYAVRPALRIPDLKLLSQNKGLVEYSGHMWEVIDEELELVIAHKIIKHDKFDNRSNDYETSYIKSELEKLSKELFLSEPDILSSKENEPRQLEMEIVEMYIDKNADEHIDTGGRLASATVRIDKLFLIHNVNLMQGKNGLFVSMPSVKNAKGEYQDYAYFNNRKDSEALALMIGKEFVHRTGLERPDTAHLKVNLYLEERGNQKAYATVIINDCMNINRIRIMQGQNGLFVSMPKYKDAKGEYHEVISPANTNAYKAIQDKVMEEYKKALGHKQEKGGQTHQQKGKRHEAR